jgi:hypothetical protein
MTPCEEAGYKVDDCFIVTGHPWLPVGTTVRLIEDNGSCQPLFETLAPINPRPGAVYYQEGTQLYMSIGYLSEPPEAKPATEPAKVSANYTDQYVDRFDSVEKPAHYASGEIECIDAMRAQMSKEEFEGHMKGNVVKYMWRWRDKGGVESLKKARWYLNKLIESAE